MGNLLSDWDFARAYHDLKVDGWPDYARAWDAERAARLAAEKERDEVCRELGCITKPGVMLRFVKDLRTQLQKANAREVELLRSWDQASLTERQELDQLRRGWGPSTPTERQSRRLDLLACMRAFTRAMDELTAEDEDEVDETAQKKLDAAYDVIDRGYTAVIAIIDVMHEPIAKPDIDWRTRAEKDEAALAEPRNNALQEAAAVAKRLFETGYPNPTDYDYGAQNACTTIEHTILALIQPATPAATGASTVRTHDE